MRRISKRKAARDRECREFCEQLKNELDRCELCGYDQSRAEAGGQVVRALYTHHIARGIHRAKAMDKRFAVLVVCFFCHMNRIHGDEHWPESRQLAVLLKSRPHDHSLSDYNALIGLGAGAHF